MKKVIKSNYLSNSSLTSRTVALISFTNFAIAELVVLTLVEAALFFLVTKEFASLSTFETNDFNSSTCFNNLPNQLGQPATLKLLKYLISISTMQRYKINY